MKPLAISVVGASGRMGRELVKLISASPRFTLNAAINSSGPSLESALQGSDVAIDFSTAANTDRLLRVATALKIPLVIGTTGHDEGFLERLKAAAEIIPIFFAPNFSLGFHVMKRAAELIYALCKEEYSIAIRETHHVGKKDAPSGSAKVLFRLVEQKASITSVRLPDVVGDHELLFSNGYEEIKLQHRCLERAVFAKGALDAASFLAKKSPALYTMETKEESVCTR